MKAGVYALVGAVALGLSASAAAQSGALAPGEIALHISAQGSVPADYATLEFSLTGRGATRDEAEASLRQSQQRIANGLEAAGVASTSISVSRLELTELDEVAIVAAPPPIMVARVPDDDDEAEVARPVVPAPRPPLRWTARATMTVTIADLDRLTAVTQAARAGGTFGGATRPRFHFRDEAKAEREAIAAALAEARADAQTHADALGYRVVRIVAVSNDGAPLSLTGILQAIGSIENPSRDWFLLGRKVATVGVDFALAPK